MAVSVIVYIFDSFQNEIIQTANDKNKTKMNLLVFGVLLLMGTVRSLSFSSSHIQLLEEGGQKTSRQMGSGNSCYHSKSCQQLLKPLQ